MKSKTALTKKDLVVVLCCVIFLLGTLGAVGSGGRKRAKEAVCLSNLRQWGAIWSMYLDDNDGTFTEGWMDSTFANRFTRWLHALEPYYKNRKLLLCPAATKPWFDKAGNYINSISPFRAWGWTDNHPLPQGSWMDDGYKGSYGENDWVCDNHHPCECTSGNPPIERQGARWRTPNVKGAAEIPLLLDAWWYRGAPHHDDAPPLFREDLHTWPDNQMRFFCLDRHSEYINGLFVDLSARKIGLKELWNLKWHRLYDTHAPKPNWATEAPWMSGFKDY